MKYTIYEDPLTHRFAFLPLPDGFVEGDGLPRVVTDHWFGSLAEAIAALPELLNRQEGDEPEGRDEPEGQQEPPSPRDGRPPPVKYGPH